MVNRCKQCRKEIVGEYVRIDAGTRLTTGEVIRADVNLHPVDCYGPYMLAHYPWLTTTHTRDRTRVDWAGLTGDGTI